VYPVPPHAARDAGFHPSCLTHPPSTPPLLDPGRVVHLHHHSFNTTRPCLPGGTSSPQAFPLPDRPRPACYPHEGDVGASLPHGAATAAAPNAPRPPSSDPAPRAAPAHLAVHRGGRSDAAGPCGRAVHHLPPAGARPPMPPAAAIPPGGPNPAAPLLRRRPRHPLAAQISPGAASPPPPPPAPLHRRPPRRTLRQGMRRYRRSHRRNTDVIPTRYRRGVTIVQDRVNHESPPPA